MAEGLQGERGGNTAEAKTPAGRMGRPPTRLSRPQGRIDHPSQTPDAHTLYLLDVRDGIDTNDFQAFPHAHTRSVWSRLLSFPLLNPRRGGRPPSLARSLYTAGRVHGRPETSVDLRSRRLGSLMALVGSRSTR